MQNTPKKLFNPAAALERFEDDFDLLFKLAAIFHEELPSYKNKLENAFYAGSVDQIERLAHTIRGSAHTIGAEQLAVYAEEVEVLSRAPFATIEKITTKYENMRLQIELIGDELAAWINNPVIDLPD